MFCFVKHDPDEEDEKKPLLGGSDKIKNLDSKQYSSDQSDVRSSAIDSKEKSGEKKEEEA